MSGRVLGRLSRRPVQESTLSVVIHDVEPAATVLGPGAAAAPRYLLLLMVLLLAGGFSGQQVYLVAFGGEYSRVTKACTADAQARFPITASPDSTELAEALRYADQVERYLDAAMSCIAVHQRKQAAAAAVGALSVLAIGVLLMFLLPTALLRRAGPLRPAPSLQARADALGTLMGLRRAPRVMFGGLHLREPFTAAGAGGIQVVLPRGVALLPAVEMDAVLAHELAHVAGRDVRVVWLTRGVWWALPAALLAPVALALAQRSGMVTDPYAGTGVKPIALGYWAEVMTYSAGLLLVAVLVAFRVLRCREHLADLRSSRVLGSVGLSSLLGRHPTQEGPRWRRFSATHPLAQHRLLALRSPGASLGVSALDAAIAGVLAGQVFAFAAILTNLAVGTTWPLLVMLVPAVLTAVLLALTWAPMVWRSAATAHLGGSRWWAPTAIVGLSAGVGLSVLVHPWGNGVGGPFAAVLTSWLVAGGSVLTIAVAKSTTDRTRGGAMTVCAAALLLLIAFTAGTQLAVGAKSPAAVWEGFLAISMLVTFLGPAVMLLVMGLSLLAWWAVKRSDPQRPTHALSRRSLTLTALVAAGSAVTTAQLAGLLTGDDGLRVVMDISWTAAAAGVACVLGAYASQGGPAGTTTLAIAPLATATTVTAAMAAHWPQWSAPLPGTERVGQRAASMLIVAMLMLAPLLASLPAWPTSTNRTAAFGRHILVAALSAGLVLLSRLL